MVVSAVASLVIMAGGNPIDANAAGEYYTWRVGDSYCDQAEPYEIVEAYLLVKADLENNNPKVFNPNVWSNSSPRYLTAEGYFDDEQVEYNEFAFTNDSSSGAIKNAVSMSALNTYLLTLYNSGYYFFIDKLTIDYPDYSCAVDKISNGIINLFDPYGKASVLDDLFVDKLSKNYSIRVLAYKTSNAGAWRNKITTTTTKPVTPTYSLVTGKYFIKNNSTGTYMNVAGGKDADTTNIGLAANTASNAFIMNITAVKSGDASKGTYIMPACSTKRVVNPYADTPTSGTNVNLYLKDSSGTQYWLWETVSGGYVIRNYSNKNLVLTADGTNVCVKTYTGAKTQIWSLENVFTPVEISGNYYLKNSGTGTYAYAAGAAKESNIALGAKKENASYQMNIAPVKKGTPAKGALITPKSSSLVMNPFSDTPASGANVNIYTNSGDGTQYWIFEKVSGGYIIHNSYNQNLVLNANGSNVNIATKSSSKNQIWVLEAVTTATTTTTTKATTTTTAATTTTAVPLDIEDDVNSDGVFNSADLVLLQKWLLAVPGTELKNAAAADMCKDGRIDVFDIIEMRKSLSAD